MACLQLSKDRWVASIKMCIITIIIESSLVGVVVLVVELVIAIVIVAFMCTSVRLDKLVSFVLLHLLVSCCRL